MIPYFSMEKATVLSNTFSFVFRMVWRRLWGALTLYTVSNERLPQWNRVLWCSRRWHFAILIVSSSHVHTHLEIPSVKTKLMSKYSRLLSQGIFLFVHLYKKRKKNVCAGTHECQAVQTDAWELLYHKVKEMSICIEHTLTALLWCLHECGHW